MLEIRPCPDDALGFPRRILVYLTTKTDEQNMSMILESPYGEAVEGLIDENEVMSAALDEILYFARATVNAEEPATPEDMYETLTEIYDIARKIRSE